MPEHPPRSPGNPTARPAGGSQRRSAGDHFRARALALAGLSLVAIAELAACTATALKPLDSPRSNDLVAATDALVDMPVGGPEIIGVIDQSSANRIAQRILLATATQTYGQNAMEIRIAALPMDIGVEGEGQSTGVTPQIVRTELRNLFPTIPMGVSNLFVQNDYGPFGYAIGRPETGDTCLYAWQVIRGKPQPLSGVPNGVVSLRLRMCDARASADDLLAVMYGFTLKAAVPIEPPLVRPELARSGAPVFAVPVGTPAPVATSTGIGRAAEPVVIPRRPRTTVVAPAPPPPPAVPLPGYPTVPLPPGATLPGGNVAVPADAAGVVVPLPPN